MDGNLEQHWVQVLEGVGQWAVSVRSSILPRGLKKDHIDALLPIAANKGGSDDRKRI